MQEKTETYRTGWNGHLLEIQYEPLDARPRHRRDLAYIEVRSISPTDAPLPIARTGFYRHTLLASTITAGGGPVAFIDVMLEVKPCPST